MTLQSLESMIRRENERRQQVYVERSLREVEFIQSLDMNAAEMSRYQDRVSRIASNLSVLLASRPKLQKRASRLFR